MRYKNSKAALLCILLSVCMLCACSGNIGYHEEAKTLAYGDANARTMRLSSLATYAQKPAPTPLPSITKPTAGYVTANELNLRSEPNTKSTILKECTKNTPVVILAKKGDWYKVRINDRLEGYMLGEYVAKGEPPKSKPAPAKTESPTKEAPVKTEKPIKETPVRTEKPVTKSATVYITKTGEKYHEDGCRYLRKSQIAISLSEAQSRGFTACSVCH